MKRPPTDFELLKEIYSRHRNDFEGAGGSRAAKIMVPVDLQDIADRLGVDADSVFGRRYYYLEEIAGALARPSSSG